MPLAKAINNETWLIANTCITEAGGSYGYKNAASENILTYGYVGTMYIIQSYTGSSSYPFLYFNPLGAGLNITKK